MNDIRNTKFIVYGIRCENNGCIYIGSTSQFEFRIRSHFGELRRGEKSRVYGKDKRGKSLWQKDFDKYGEAAFKVYILERDVGFYDRKFREEYWIKKYQSTESEHGYNYMRVVPRDGIYVEPGLPPFPPEKLQEDST